MDFEWKLRGGSWQTTRSGYNLANLDADSFVKNGVTVTNNGDGSWTFNGTSSSSGDLILTKNILSNHKIYQFEDAKYLFKTIVVSGSFSNPNKVIVQTSAMGQDNGVDNFATLYNKLSDGVFVNIFNKKSTSHLSRFELYCGPNVTFNNYTIKILFAKTDNNELEWEQYGASPSPDYPSEIETVGSNVNLCDNSKILVGVDPKNSSEKDFRTSDYIKVEHGKSYIASLYNEKKVRIGNLVYNEWNKNLEKLGQITTDTIKITNQDTAYVTVRNYKNDAEEIKNEFYYKFEESLIATPYSPYGMGSAEIKVENGLDTTDINYKSQTKVLPIQQEMLEGDYVANVEHHEWKKLVLAGDEDFEIATSSNGFNAFLNRKIISDNSLEDITTYCNNFKSATDINFNLMEDNTIFGGRGYQHQLLIRCDKYTTVEDFKAMLKSKYNSGTPVTIYYKLAEPLNLELTSEQKAIRNQKLYTYKNITNISLSDELASIDVTYKKDLETMFNNIIKQIPSSTSDTVET